MTSTQKQRRKNDICIPKYEKINFIVRTIREWDDDECDFFYSERFCEDLINQYCEEEKNKCKAKTFIVKLLFAPVKLFQSIYDVFYNSKDK